MIAVGIGVGGKDLANLLVKECGKVISSQGGRKKYIMELVCTFYLFFLSVCPLVYFSVCLSKTKGIISLYVSYM